jgi:hypothetical protein
MEIKLPKKAKLFYDYMRDGATQTLLLEFAACRRRAELAYVEGWSTEHSSNAMTFGTLFHGCLEALYHNCTGKPKPTNEALKLIIHKVLNNFRLVVEKERFWSLEDAESNELNKAFLYMLLPLYVQKYWKPDSEKKWVRNETVFKQTFRGLPMTGKFDRVAENKHKEIWVYETKTKSRIDPTLQDRLSFDFQSNYYILNVWLELGRFPTGFVYDMIQRPGQRQGMKESLKDFVGRVADTVDDSYFQRIVVTRTKQEFEQWLEQDLDPLIGEFMLWRRGALPTYRNAASCETRYGACKFLKVCGLGTYTGLYKRKVLFPELAD